MNKSYENKALLTKDKTMIKVVEYQNKQDSQKNYRLLMTDFTSPNCCFDIEGERNHDYYTRVISMKTTLLCLSYTYTEIITLYNDLKQVSRIERYDYDKKICPGYYFENISTMIKYIENITNYHSDGRKYQDYNDEHIDDLYRIKNNKKEKNRLQTILKKSTETINLFAKKHFDYQTILSGTNSKPVHEILKLDDRLNLNPNDESYKKIFTKEFISELISPSVSFLEDKIKSFNKSNNKYRAQIIALEDEIATLEKKCNSYQPEPVESEATGILRKSLLIELQGYSKKIH